ncbi:MAG: sigma-70 family RNA polymerase sigma factor [Chloroflexota bacterium]
MIESTASDRQVIDAVLAGDREAFRVLVERESGPVIEACRRVLRDPVEAQDVAQDAFTQAFQALATFRGDGPFAAWLRRIAVRTAIARLAARPNLVTLDGETPDPVAATLQSDDDPEGHALDMEHRAAVADAIRTLPAAQRDVVLLRFYGDLSLEEIAKVTHHPVGTVKSRLSRGVASLRDQLTPRST